jgi:hypothetical protein
MMPTQQAETGTRVDQAQPSNTIRPHSADENRVNAVAMSRWLNETPDQGPWNAIASMSEPGAGDRMPKSKC